MRDLLAVTGGILVLSGLWMITPGLAVTLVGTLLLTAAVILELIASNTRPPDGGR